MKSLIVDSVITCDEVIGTLDTVPINSNDEKATYKVDYYILHIFLLVTILILVIVTICYYCIKDRIKEKNIYHIQWIF